jgi:hypothetical protein
LEGILYSFHDFILIDLQNNNDISIRFFAAYQGTRKLLKYNITQSGEANLITAGLLTLTPMMFVPTLRPLIPYGMFLIAVDSFNGINDI